MNKKLCVTMAGSALLAGCIIGGSDGTETVARMLSRGGEDDARPIDVTMRPDGDVKTIAEALAKVCELREKGEIPTNRAAEVLVTPGVYRMTEPVVFMPTNSSIHFSGVIGKEEAVFDGGVELPPFTAGANGLWETTVPAGMTVEQLWVNDVRATRARTPNEFYLYMKAPYEEDVDPATGKAADMSRTAFYAQPADIAPLASLPADELARVQVLAWQSWDMGYSPLRSVDAKTGLVTMRGGTARPCYAWSSTQPRYALENYRAALDAPGEWFHDVKAGRLLYIPRAGEDILKTRAVVPVAHGFLVLKGTPTNRVKDVWFHRVSFVHGAYNLPENGVRNAQSAQNVPDAAIRAESIEKCVFARGRIAHMGAHGIWLRNDCHDSSIEDMLIEDLGCGGVYFGDTRVPAKEQAASGLKLYNSIVRHGGLTFNGAIGVWLGHAHDCVIEHNDIADFRYTGVSMGWTWGYAPTVVRRNRLAYNRIHHIGWGVLSDMGAVYTLGDSEGTEVVCNWIHDVNGYAGAGSPAWGLYTDEGSHGILFASNLVERCRDGAVHQHYGKENTFKNNIFTSFERNGLWRSRVEDHKTLFIENNIFYWANTNACAMWGGGGGRRLKSADLTFDRNLYWCTAPGGVNDHAFNWCDWNTWRAEGQDKNSQIADPMFIDAPNGNWNLHPQSPARRLGFVPFDWRQAGVVDTWPVGYWRAVAEGVKYPPVKDAPPAPRFLRGAYRQAFEALPVGNAHRVAAFGVSAGKVGAIKVVNTGAAQGTKCLQLTDSPDLPLAWQPHLYYDCCLTSGVARVRFAIKGDADADVLFECRDYHPVDKAAYATGPTVRLVKGKLSVPGQELLTLPAGTWCTVEVVINLSGANAGSWSCTATPAGGAAKTAQVKGGPKSTFRNLEWTGFISCGARKFTWWLDDYQLSDK